MPMSEPDELVYIVYMCAGNEIEIVPCDTEELATHVQKSFARKVAYERVLKNQISPDLLKDDNKLVEIVNKLDDVQSFVLERFIMRDSEFGGAQVAGSAVAISKDDDPDDLDNYESHGLGF